MRHLFISRLLNNHSDVRKTFTTLTNMSDEEMSHSPVLKAHVLVFGNTVNTWIQKLDDTETLVALIQKLADSHVIRGIKNPKFFKVSEYGLTQYKSVS